MQRHVGILVGADDLSGIVDACCVTKISVGVRNLDEVVPVLEESSRSTIAVRKDAYNLPNIVDADRACIDGPGVVEGGIQIAVLQEAMDHVILINIDAHNLAGVVDP